jgi:hypothetical protein
MEEGRENKAYVSFRATVDVAMGILYIFISLYCMLLPAIIEQYGKSTVYTLGILFTAYGLFRSFRGVLRVKQSFFTKSQRKSYRNDNV